MTESFPFAVDPVWYRPKGTEDFPTIWLDWLLHWAPRVEGHHNNRSRLFWYPGSRGAKASWLLLPATPVYGAHRLHGWPSNRRPVTDGLRDLTDLHWEPIQESGDDLVGVWPNRLAIGSKGEVIAVPATSHIARDRREDAEGLPVFVQHEAPAAPNPGAFHLFVIDGHYRQHAAVARRIMSATDQRRRQQILHDVLHLGPTDAATALLLRATPHPAWLVLRCRYPEAARALAPDIPDRMRLSLLRTLMTTLVESALPGIERHDDGATDPERAALAGALRHEILRALALEPKAATAANIATALIPDATRGRKLIMLLGRGWRKEPAITAELNEWNTVTLESPLDRALVPLGRLLGSPADDGPRLVAVRHWVLQHLADGIDERLIATLADAEDDPADDRSLMHWVTLLGIAILLSRLSDRVAVPTR